MNSSSKRSISTSIRRLKPADKAAARGVLLEIVDQAVARLRAIEAERLKADDDARRKEVRTVREVRREQNGRDDPPPWSELQRAADPERGHHQADAARRRQGLGQSQAGARTAERASRESRDTGCAGLCAVEAAGGDVRFWIAGGRGRRPSVGGWRGRRPAPNG